MTSLIGFEFKKIITRKPTYITAAIVFVMMIGLYFLNINSWQAVDNELDPVSGFNAVAVMKDNAQALAGPITNERATEEFRAYRAFFQDEGELKEEFVGEDASGLQFALYENQHRAFMQTFLTPWMEGPENTRYTIWRVDTTKQVDLYSAIETSFKEKLDGNMGGTWTFSDAERDFWLSHYSETPKPIEYGYADGWMNLFDCFGFLMVVLIAICVGVTPVFSAEYRDKTDAILLSTRYGKNRLVAAKIIAAFLYASAMMVVGLLIAIGLPLLFYGADGAALPIQLMNAEIPYSLTMAQAAALCAGIAFLVALGLTAFMLFLSAKWKSSLGIVMVGIALILLPTLLPLMKNGLVAHFGVLLPTMPLSFSNMFSTLLSYPLGSFVVDAKTVVVFAYVVIIAVFVPLAMCGFRRHQVA